VLPGRAVGGPDTAGQTRLAAIASAAQPGDVGRR